MTVTLSLPMPPSVNSLYANAPGRGRVKTRNYTKWREAAGWLLVAQRPGRIKGRYSLDIAVPARTRGDISNLIKATEDLLVLHGVTDDDSNAWAVSIRRDEGATEAQITVGSVA